MMFGGKTGAEESARIIDTALDAGINFLDTANVYSRGSSEEVTGEALARGGKRSRVVLATKVHGRMAEDDPNAGGNTRRHILSECEASLRRLGTETIDLYQIHRPQSDVPIDETLRALDDLIRSGKVRYIGTSTYSAWQSVEALWVSDRMGLNRFVSEQPPYNLLDRRIERELLPMARTYGYAILPWGPLGGGLLTGKYRRGQPLPPDSRFAGYEQNEIQKRRYTAGVFSVTEGLEPLAAQKGCTLSQLALAWVLGQPGVTSPIVGPRTTEQLKDNLGALEVTLTDDDRKKIDALIPPGGMLAPFYEADFGPHPYR
jgi:aryl-alcohol dehydrogenase-like predicted oxidoreductase